MNDAFDLVGTRFGRLTVAAKSPLSNSWLCRCDCGKSVHLIKRELSDYSSCGCGGPPAIPLRDTASFNPIAGTVTIQCAEYERLKKSEQDLLNLLRQPSTSAA